MARPWQTLDSVPTDHGPLELRRRGDDDFLIALGPRVLMTSAAHRSEQRLATLVCEPLAGRPRPRVLIGGLGLGYTLRAALDRLPADAEVVVAEIEAAVVRWCEGPCASASSRALADPRVSVRVDAHGPSHQRTTAASISATTTSASAGSRSSAARS
ncbi:MAG: spermidine synthase, partial [Myxococcota bacterium]